MSDVEQPPAVHRAKAAALAASAPNSLLEGLVHENGMAEARGVDIRTLRTERARGSGPPWIRMNRQIYYRIDGFRQWLETIETKPVRSRKAG